MKVVKDLETIFGTSQFLSLINYINLGNQFSNHDSKNKIRVNENTGYIKHP